MQQVSLSRAIKPASALLEDRTERLPTGLEALDDLLAGGFPQGKISEVAGVPSSGRTSLVFSTLARTTTGGEIAAYVDAFDVFDPLSAAQSGIALSRLLWVRCDGSQEKAAAAADLIARAGGFAMVVWDAAPPDEHSRRQGFEKPPSHVWFRLKQAIEGSKTVLLVLNLKPSTGSAASVVLTLNRTMAVWRPNQRAEERESLRRPGLFKGLVFEAEIQRGKSHGRVRVHSRI